MDLNLTNKEMSKALGRKYDYHGDNYEWRIEKKIMKSKIYNNVYKGPGVVYNYLWMSIVRAPIKGDKYNIYENYYDCGQLACAPKIETIAKACNMYKTQVRRYLKYLKDLEVIQIFTKRVSYSITKNIYVLGFIAPETGKEIFFMEKMAEEEVPTGHK
ncbi:MAG: hypothetical protein ACW980_23800 [Promethearchaeota archaeon]|jgi:hypothetical protein